MRIPMAFVGLLVAGCVPVVLAQDAAKVDSAHYKVISENSQVRILRVHYGPHEKSAMMHSHPDAVVVFLTDGKTEFHLPGGKTEISDGKAGSAVFTPHTVHQPENLTDHAVDAIVIELKK